MADSEQAVTINGKQYAVDKLGDNAKAQLGNIRFVDKEIEDTKNRMAVLQAARLHYYSVLDKELQGLDD